MLELGWGFARPGEPGPVVASWIELPPGQRVSRIVRELTGFDERARTAAIPAEVAWSNLLGDAAALPRSERGIPTVIHFSRFELAFLRDLHARLQPSEPFPLDALCLHEVARRLFPDLPRRSLRALAGFLGHSPELVRRSGGHVEATVFAWRALQERLDALGLRDWEELRAFLEAKAPKRSSRRGFPITAERRRALPDAPGVYRFVRSNGDVLYVGKAASLRKRVSSHYGAGSKATERSLEMLTQAHDIIITETSSTLEAALLEVDEIKRLDPPYNVHLKEGTRRAWFAGSEEAEAASEPTDKTPLGPLPSRGSLRAFSALVALAAGRPRDAAARAAALGAPEVFAPEPAAFEPAWESFVSAHLARGRTTWSRALRGSAAIRFTEEAESDDTEGWDPPRVRRHLERVLRSGGQLLRRARIMTILSDACVAFREKGAPGFRQLTLVGCEIVERRDLPDGETVGEGGPRRPWRERQQAFDAARYDRLRVLVTELCRVQADGGEIVIGIGGRVLTAPAALRLLRTI